MDSACPIPEGFVPYSQPSPFLDRIGPVYERRSKDGVEFGLLILDYHCNRRDIVHGGLLVTLADVALGKTAEWLNDPPTRLLTISIAYDFMGSGKLGDWIEARTDFYRVGRDVAFANCYFRSNGKVIGRASGQFKVAADA